MCYFINGIIDTIKKVSCWLRYSLCSNATLLNSLYWRKERRKRWRRRNNCKSVLILFNFFINNLKKIIDYIFCLYSTINYYYYSIFLFFFNKKVSKRLIVACAQKPYNSIGKLYASSLILNTSEKTNTFT